MKKIEIDDFEIGMSIYFQNKKYGYKATGIIKNEEYSDYSNNYFVIEPREVFENTQNKFIATFPIRFSSTYANRGWEFYEINSINDFKEKYPEYFI